MYFMFSLQWISKKFECEIFRKTPHLNYPEMKNSMLKGAHLSEGKSQDILRYFSEDLTATQIANLTGVSRVTVNNYFRTIRLRIARHCEEKNPSSNYSKNHSVVYLKKESNDYENGPERHQTLYVFIGTMEKFLPAH